jgi:hypothetical protein
VMAALISVASVTASALDCGLSFQFPLMIGFRAISRAVPVRGTPKIQVGAKAAAELARARKERAVNFIVAMIRVYDK